jgi:hypothetical protein
MGQDRFCDQTYLKERPKNLRLALMVVHKLEKFYFGNNFDEIEMVFSVF